MPPLSYVTVIAYTVAGDIPTVKDVRLDEGILCFYKNAEFRQITNFPETRLSIYDVYQRRFESIPTFSMMDIDPSVNPYVVVRGAGMSDDDCLELEQWVGALRGGNLENIPLTLPDAIPSMASSPKIETGSSSTSAASIGSPITGLNGEPSSVTRPLKRKRRSERTSGMGDKQLLKFTRMVTVPGLDYTLEVTTCVGIVEVIDLTTDDIGLTS